jgi:hypothetical protein
MSWEEFDRLPLDEKLDLIVSFPGTNRNRAAHTIQLAALEEREARAKLAEEHGATKVAAAIRSRARL